MSTKRISFFLILAVFVVYSSGVEITLQNGVNNYNGCADTYLNEEETQNNFGMAQILNIQKKDGEEYRILIRYDLSHIQNVSMVNKAELKLYCESDNEFEESTLNVSFANSAWIENETNWINTSESEQWDSEGGDIGDKITTVKVEKVIAGKWITFDVSKAINKFFKDPKKNFGIFITSESKEKISFYGSNIEFKNFRPTLYIDAPVALKKGIVTKNSNLLVSVANDNLIISNNKTAINDLKLLSPQGKTISHKKGSKTLSVKGFKSGIYFLMVNNKFHSKVRL